MFLGARSVSVVDIWFESRLGQMFGLQSVHTGALNYLWYCERNCSHKTKPININLLILSFPNISSNMSSLKLTNFNFYGMIFCREREGRGALVEHLTVIPVKGPVFSYKVRYIVDF